MLSRSFQTQREMRKLRQLRLCAESRAAVVACADIVLSGVFRMTRAEMACGLMRQSTNLGTRPVFATKLASVEAACVETYPGALPALRGGWETADHRVPFALD